MSLVLNYKNFIELNVRHGYYVIDGSIINNIFDNLPNNSYAYLLIQYDDNTIRACVYIVIRFDNTNNNKTIKLYNGFMHDSALVKTMPYQRDYDLTIGIQFHDFWKKYEAFIQYGDNRTLIFISQDAYLSGIYYDGNRTTMPAIQLIPLSVPPPANSTTTHDGSTEKPDETILISDAMPMIGNMMDLMTRMINMMLMMMVMTMPIRMMADIVEAIRVE